jgi:clan AA aspartic protease
MMSGIFRDHLPRITLELPSRDRTIPVEFVLDTGFDGDLTLPSRLVRLLQTAPLFTSLLSLADGSIGDFPVHELVLEWNGTDRPVEVLVLEGSPLLGTLLLDGCQVHLDMVEGGEVVVDLPD